MWNEFVFFNLVYSELIFQSVRTELVEVSERRCVMSSYPSTSSGRTGGLAQDERVSWLRVNGLKKYRMCVFQKLFLSTGF